MTASILSAIPRRAAALALAASAVGLLAATAVAQTPGWPNRPVKIVVPFPPGGTTDIAARAIGEEMSKSIGQPVIVENRPGANTNIGSSYVARSPGDGYTMLMASSSVTTNPSLYKSLDYDTARDLVGVHLVTDVALVMAVHPSIADATVADLVRRVKASGKPLNCGSSGNGSLAHLSCVLLKNRTGMDVQHVPSKGGAPMIAALIGGQVDVAFDTPAGTLPHVQAGRLRALATTGASRIAAYPGVPTMREAGVADFEIVWWAGLLAPSGTPPALVARLHEEVGRALRSPSVVERFGKLGIVASTESQPDYAARIRRDIDTWSKLARSAGLSID